jgi:hypothetical protein
MLKTKMAGIPIAPAEHRWSNAVIESNQQTANLVLSGQKR